MDTSQPVTAADFTAVGVDPATAQNLALQHNTLSGRGSFNDKVALAHSFDNMAPPPKPAAPAPTTNAQLAEATLADENARLAESFSAHWAPPVDETAYKFPESLVELKGDAAVADLEARSALRSAAFAEKIPLELFNSLGKTMAESERRQAVETPEQQDARAASETASLRRMLGNTYDQDIAAVKNYLDGLGQRNATLKNFIANGPPLDAFAINELVQYVKHGRR